MAALFGTPVLAAAIWLAIPTQTLFRIGSVVGELQRGDLNQRWNIWLAGWQAFVHAPLFGSGVGSFVLAARTAPLDTAHNTALALAVEGGMVAVLIGLALVVASGACVLRTRGPLRIALGSTLAVGLLSSLVATVQENRATWLLLGMVAIAARLTPTEQALIARVIPKMQRAESSYSPAAANAREGA